MEIYTATGEEGFDQMMQMIQNGKVRSRDARTPAQLALCDGRPHWVVNVELVEGELFLSWSRLLTREELLDGEGDNAPYVDEAYYGEDGCVSYGYLPARTWDEVYYPEDPDLHDRVACQMYEITEEQFAKYAANDWCPDKFMKDPELQSLTTSLVIQHLADRKANW